METVIKVKNLKPGDILLVKDTTDEEASAVLINTKLSETWNTTQKGEYKCAALAADMVQQIFSHLDQMEKSERYRRHAQGIATAKARGAKFRRRPKERPAMLDSVRKLWEHGEISAREAGKQLGISHVTFLAWVNEA